MPNTPRETFTIHLNEAQKAVNDSIPAAASYFRAPTGILRAHEGFESSLGKNPNAIKAMHAYSALTDHLALHLERGATILEDTAEALGEILDLYRTADGQA